MNPDFSLHVLVEFPIVSFQGFGLLVWLLQNTLKEVEVLCQSLLIGHETQGKGEGREEGDK